jgi:hypothetical protein
MHVVAVSYYKLGLFDVRISEPVIELNCWINHVNTNCYIKFISEMGCQIDCWMMCG